VKTLIEIPQRIKQHYQQLSKGQQKIAKYLLEQPWAFAIKSAEEIGKDVGVSETTVIRLCYSLQLNGFSELQKTVRENLILHESSLDQFYSKKLELAEAPNFFAQVMEQDRKNIQQTILNINEELLQQTVEQLIETKQIYITGLRSSYAPAHWLYFSLGLMRENVFFYKPDVDDLFSTLNHMNENTTFVAISFHRYLKNTVKMAELAKKQGAFVIGITDSTSAPLSDYADILLVLTQQEKSTIDALPSLFSLLNAIIASVSVKDKDHFEKRKKQYESLNVGDFFYD
jgi:DNA-binding MurR/RpiR family transcriptional regulator